MVILRNFLNIQLQNMLIMATILTSVSHYLLKPMTINIKIYYYQKMGKILEIFMTSNKLNMKYKNLVSTIAVHKYTKNFQIVISQEKKVC